jgi:hypothetical protein
MAESGHHINNAWELADAQAGRAFQKFEGTGFQGFVSFLCLVCLAGIFALVGFGCYICAGVAKDIADSAKRTADKIEDVRDLQTKADARGENALRMMAAVPFVLEKQTSLLESLTKRQDIDDRVSQTLLDNQKLLLENQRSIIEVLQRLTSKVDGAIELRTRRTDGGEESNTKNVVGSGGEGRAKGVLGAGG